MTTEASARQKTTVNQPLETSIQIGLAALLVISCLLILRPFVPLITWGIIIAIASYPTFLKLKHLLKGRRTLAAVLWTLLLLAVLVIPLVLLAQSIMESVPLIVARVRDGSLAIPQPPASVQQWPLIGPPLFRFWSSADQDLANTLMKFAPQIKSALPGIVAASAGLGSTVLQFFLSILLSGAVLANADSAYKLTRTFAIRLFGEEGPDYQKLVGTTIRSVTFGILGVALIQTVFAAAGFFLVGLPAVGLWVVLMLAAAILQFGVLVLLPAVIFVFATAATTKAVVFLIWCIIVGLMDNVLKPILLGRGAAVPIAVVFLGVLGGFIAMGIIGLFIGAIVLSVGYKLFLSWIHGRAAVEAHD